MDNSLTANPETSLLSPEGIKQARQFSGESTRTYIPYVPVIKINNKKEKREQEIDGQLQEVELPIKKGFTITEKLESGEYETKFFAETLEAVILKERYKIESKYVDPKYRIAPDYYSVEFDKWNQLIEVFSEGELVNKGTYQELCNLYKTGEVDKVGRPKKSFDVFLILYLDLAGKIYRFKWRMGMDNKWFDYKNRFGHNDTYVAYKTIFNLVKSTGELTYYYAEFEKGERVDLSKELELQKEIQKFLIISNEIVSEGKETIITPEEPAIIEYPPVDNSEEIDISSIPF